VTAMGNLENFFGAIYLRDAIWFIFKPNPPVLVNFGRPLNGIFKDFF
jgi:hypothetical protein